MTLSDHYHLTDREVPPRPPAPGDRLVIPGQSPKPIARLAVINTRTPKPPQYVVETVDGASHCCIERRVTGEYLALGPVEP